MDTHKSTDVTLIVDKIKNNTWVFGILLLLIALFDRGIATIADGHITLDEFWQMSLISFLFLSWLHLKPTLLFEDFSASLDQAEEFHAHSEQDQLYLQKAKSRMDELQDQHLISQKYTLAFPYVCQIYHLLNLKHLEKVHNFSLNNLRVVEVSHFEPTAIGGSIKFQTMLDSPFNALRIWRQPVVEVDLTLHTPYMVELSIPVYGEKRMTVIFNVLPINQNEHQFFIDIYSDLKFPKPILQGLLHIAACLTLYEDLPYLHRLSERSLSRLVSLGRVSDHETMLLFKRFVDLYRNQVELASMQATA
jgi:hypothetical protein